MFSVGRRSIRSLAFSFLKRSNSTCSGFTRPDQGTPAAGRPRPRVPTCATRSLAHRVRAPPRPALLSSLWTMRRGRPRGKMPAHNRPPRGATRDAHMAGRPLEGLATAVEMARACLGFTPAAALEHIAELIERESAESACVARLQCRGIASVGRMHLGFAARRFLTGSTLWRPGHAGAAFRLTCAAQTQRRPRGGG
ncbi:hypothetical protein D9M72_424780 [compost metagenome]